MTQKTEPGSSEAARLAVEVATEKQASDIVLLDMRSVCSFTDYFVVLTAESRRQMQALVEDLDAALDTAGVSLHHREGGYDGGWVLMDYGDLIVHVFGPEEREFYQIERLWAHAPVLLRIQ
ncbi:MAG: ribosome silencing factor [Chloroflexi bacterium]|nr:ribosome silencing factor [Chloroflexota bacterium]